MKNQREEPRKAAPRPRYERPSLRVYGKVTDLTAGLRGFGRGEDGTGLGFFPSGS